MARTNVKLFADDTKIYISILCQTDYAKLQLTTGPFCEWTKIWDLDFNSAKCKRLNIGKKDLDVDYYMASDNNRITITWVKEEKDLGVIIDRELQFDSHVNSKISKANQNLGIIRRSFRYMEKTMFLQLYKAIVRPHLEYASPV